MVKIFLELQFSFTEAPILEYPSRNILYVYKQLAMLLYLKFLFKSTILMLWVGRDRKTIQSLIKKEVLMTVSDFSLPFLWVYPLMCQPVLGGFLPALPGCIWTLSHLKPVLRAPIASCLGFSDTYRCKILENPIGTHRCPPAGTGK